MTITKTTPKKIYDFLVSAFRKTATTMSYGKIEIDNTATLILSENSGVTGFIIYNNSAQTVYLGNASVTIVNGMPIEAGASYSNDLWIGVIYGIVSAGTSDVRVEVFY